MRECQQCGGIGGEHYAYCTRTDDALRADHVLNAVIDTGEEYVVTKGNMPAAVIMPYNKYRELLKAMES